jgi:hypothetical protein
VRENSSRLSNLSLRMEWRSIGSDDSKYDRGIWNIGRYGDVIS